MKLKLLINKYLNRYSEVIKIYMIGGLIISIYGRIRVYQKQQIFNLQDPLEKTLSKIYSFYEVLNGVDNTIGEILYGTLNVENKLFDYFGGEEMGDYNINNYDSYIGDDGMEKMFPSKKGIWVGCDEELDIPYTEYYLSYNEFVLLMQIYFGLYQEEELFKKLEEKEKNGEYDEIKEILKEGNWRNKYKEYKDYEREYLPQDKVQEYLKLELMRKDTTGAFNGLEIKKIYDKNWSEEKQRKYIEEINKEYGEEVIVYEDKENKELHQEKKQKKEPAKKGFLDKIKSVFKR